MAPALRSQSPEQLPELKQEEGGREPVIQPTPSRSWPGVLTCSRQRPQNGLSRSRSPAASALARMEIPPTHYPASRAASVVENCINYQQGTPHKVFLVQTVKQASMEVSLQGAPCSVCPGDSPELSLISTRRQRQFLGHSSKEMPQRPTQRAAFSPTPQ